MPVFTVSENTCPHVGFSMNRSIRPSSAVITFPNSMTLGLRARATVTRAPVRLWKSTRAVRSMSVRASPETTRNASPARPSSAFLTLPAVPSGTDSVA